jgi:hypothetical protein
LRFSKFAIARQRFAHPEEIMTDNATHQFAARLLSAKASRLRRPGFSFTEVLFAVMILGIGFIMIAAIFPVSLAQTKATGEETAGAMIARGAAATIEEVATATNMPVSTGVEPFANKANLFKAIGGNLIVSSDTRRAWAPFYRRDTGWNYAQVIMLPVEARARTQYTGRQEGDLTNIYRSLMPRAVTITASDSTEQTVTLSGTDKASVVEGTYLIIQSDPGATGSPGRPVNYLTGRIYRIGAPTDTVNKWYLAPGADMQLDPGPDGVAYKDTKYPDAEKDNITAIPPGLSAWIVGRGHDDTLPSPTIEGAAQDISVYTTYVNLK